MNSAIEFHDSVISQIQVTYRYVFVEFSPSYVHKSDGQPGIDTGSGWLQNARLRLNGASASGNRPLLPESLWHGSLRIGGQKHNGMLPIPLPAGGPVELNLVFVSGHEIVVSGEAIELELMGEATYVEEFDGGKNDLLPSE
ncbi:MAG: hypothetical protein ACLQVF_01740 [Isosphaeraceae bacterium]